MAINKIEFEQGPIRPPSEAYSLLVRITRNCPWNRCLFCPVYKRKKFSRRSLEEIKSDIEAIYFAVEKIKELSATNGYGGKINRQTAALVQSRHPELFQVAFWQLHGGETVFLQDGDSLLLPVSEMVEILGLLKDKFPEITRITTYARSRTLLRRSADDLKKLRDAGLSRIHVGLESGNDKVLKLMKKGVTGAQHIEAGQNVKASGISLSEYVILGLGGAELWREHALDTAEVLNAINPDYIRMRTLTIRPRSPLATVVQEGGFSPLRDDDVVKEEGLFIDRLEGIESYIYSDHILNLLEEVQGQLPGDKPAMKNVIDSYLALPLKEREIFRLGRRTGHCRSLNDINDQVIRQPLEQLHNQLQRENTPVDEYVEQLMYRFM